MASASGTTTDLGELYGDLWVLLRDFDPSDGGGNGEPVLDENGQVIPIGYDPATGETFPIYLVEGAEGEYEVPADQLAFIQEVELERANIIRSPDSVVESALDDALAKIAAGTEVTADASGRIMVDGVLIDSPRECLALYKLIVQAGDATSWTDAQANFDAVLPAPIVTLLGTGWNPTGLLAGVFSKFHAVSLDAVVTAHTLMGVNEVTGSGDTLDISYYGFTDGATETFDYDRVATYGDVWVQWYQDMDGDPSDLEAVQRTLLDVIWGSDENGDGVNDVGTGVGWMDQYTTLSADGVSLEMADGPAAGLNDWAQSVEDARQVIFTMHDFVSLTEVEAPASTDDVIEGSSYGDYIATWGGDDLVWGRQGDDLIDGGDDNDILIGNYGNDRLEGGAGDDVLRGGVGDDLLLRGAGNDMLFGGVGNDRLLGGTDDDVLDGGDGEDTLVGNRGDDSLDGAAGNDVLRGGLGNDVLKRGEGNDQLFGGDGDDNLGGGVGHDVLDGGDGNDTLNGGLGVDVLTGGAGADSFVFVNSLAGQVDTITDFSAADLDLVKLDQIDANAGTAADDAFTFIGYAAFSGAAGELRATDLGGSQRVEADMDGDGVADLSFDIDGTAPVDAGWFVL